MNSFYLKLLLVIIIMALLLIGIVQNLNTVTVTYLFWSFNMPVIAVILVSFFIGFIASVLIVSLYRYNKQKTPKPENTKK